MEDTYQANLVSEQVVSDSTPAVQKTETRASGLMIVLALLAVYIIWGSTYLGIRVAIVSIPPIYMSAIRFLLAGGGLFLYLRIRGVPAPTRSQWLGSAVVGTLLLGCGNGGVAFAEQWVPSSVAALCIATTPIWMALFAGLWGRWPVRLEWIGLGIGFVGVVLLNIGGNIWANPLGALVLLFGPICWALGSAWSHHLSLPKGLMGSATQMLTGGAMLSIAGLALGEKFTVQPSLSSLIAITYLVVFGSLVAFTAYGFLLRNVRPALATSYAYVNPVVAVVLGVGFAGEHITLSTVFAMVIIIAGVVLVSIGRRK
jgi:drug/metabolite transporter (DMT)-like permease